MLIGRTVYGIDGPGQKACEGLAGSKGEIIGIETSMFGTSIMIKWEDGHIEGFAKHTVKPVSEQRGIGVYYV